MVKNELVSIRVVNRKLSPEPTYAYIPQIRKEKVGDKLRQWFPDLKGQELNWEQFKSGDRSYYLVFHKIFGVAIDELEGGKIETCNKKEEN